MINNPSVPPQLLQSQQPVQQYQHQYTQQQQQQPVQQYQQQYAQQQPVQYQQYAQQQPVQQYQQQYTQQPVQYQQQYNILLTAGRRVSSEKELNQVISSNPAYVKFYNKYWKEKSI